MTSCVVAPIKPALSLFPIIALTDDPRLQKTVSEVWGHIKVPSNHELPILSKALNLVKIYL